MGIHFSVDKMLKHASYSVETTKVKLISMKILKINDSFFLELANKCKRRTGNTNKNFYGLCISNVNREKDLVFSNPVFALFLDIF